MCLLGLLTLMGLIFPLQAADKKMVEFRIVFAKELPSNAVGMDVEVERLPSTLTGLRALICEIRTASFPDAVRRPREDAPTRRSPGDYASVLINIFPSRSKTQLGYKYMQEEEVRLMFFEEPLGHASGPVVERSFSLQEFSCPK